MVNSSNNNSNITNNNVCSAVIRYRSASRVHRITGGSKGAREDPPEIWLPPQIPDHLNGMKGGGREVAPSTNCMAPNGPLTSLCVEPPLHRIAQ